ncbi:hypothetical protein B0T10DRAFT_467008 [Thelonectria olida]|uniref:Uncharacterized protein n=1 Tax=Thelonectria olida TaxID=1576542 RepID=A0A9P9AIH1_9HYPO|nr:hypothetical protein B0T10DRAFT_467008 [Thelonectria olida]
MWGYPAREHYTHQPDLIAPIQQSCIDYAERIANSSSPVESPGVSVAQWDLVRGKAVDKELVESYLELLRPRTPGVTITTIINESDLGNALTQLNHSERTILPIQKRGEWAFAIAYPDASIQWYDSNPDSMIPALAQSSLYVSTNWFGPQHERNEDSGLFVLLGIRLLARTLPHLPQDKALSVIKTFRPRMLAELLCGRLDPSEADFQTAISSQLEPESAANSGHQPESSFFDDANWAMDASRDHSNIPSAEPNLDPSQTRTDPHEPVPRHGVVPSGAPPGALMGGQPQPKPSPKMLQPRPMDERREILRLLSRAAAFSRISRLSDKSDITLLCSYSNRQVISSEFHRRYTSVLFHNASTQLGNSANITRATNGKLNETTVRKTQSRCLVWKKLCEVGLDLNLYEFVLLCVIPEQSPNRDPPLEVASDIYCRLLNYPRDPLLYYVTKASDLCKAIVENTLHPRSLMIELYPHREGEEMTDADYDMFTSTDPHVKRGIPREKRQSYG